MTSTTLSFNDVVNDVLDNINDNEEMSPYACAKVVNSVFAKMNINKELPPQMFYTYAKKGMLNGEKNSKKITKTQLSIWMAKYFERNFK